MFELLGPLQTHMQNPCYTFLVHCCYFFCSFVCMCAVEIYLNNSAFVIEFLFLILPRFSDNNKKGRWPLCRGASREIKEIVFLGRNAMIVRSSVGSVRNQAKWTRTEKYTQVSGLWFQAGGMTQWAKVIAAKLGDLCLIPGTHTVKRKNKLIQVAL